jgi:hypothetical protein
MNPTATPRVQHKRANHTGMVTMKVCFGFMLQDYATRCPGRYCAWVGFSVAATEVIGAPSFEVEFRRGTSVAVTAPLLTGYECVSVSDGWGVRV